MQNHGKIVAGGRTSISAGEVFHNTGQLHLEHAEILAKTVLTGSVTAADLKIKSSFLFVSGDITTDVLDIETLCLDMSGAAVRVRKLSVEVPIFTNNGR